MSSNLALQSKPQAEDLDSLIHASSIFQRPLLLLLFRGLPSAFTILGMTFLSPRTQEFWCTPMYGMNTTEWRNYNQHVNYHCEYLVLNSANGTTEACHSWEYDHSVFPRTIKSEFSPVCENGWMGTSTDTLLMVGMMLGNFLFAHISDWYGRKMAIIGTVLVSFLGAMSMSAAPTFFAFVILRTVTAVGLGGGQNAPITLAMESVSPQSRAFIAFCDAFGWIVGILLLPIVPWYIRDWRYLQFILSFGNVPMLIMALSIDESARWLLASGQKERARPIIKRLLQKNGMKSDEEQIDQILNSTAIVRKETKANIKELFKSRTLAITTLSFLIQFPIAILVYYDMMFFVVDVGSNPWTNVLFTGLFELPCLVLVVLLVKLVRRKALYIVLYGVSAVAAGALYTTKKHQVIPQMAFGTICKMGVQLLFSILGVHVNERYITRTRGIALGFCTTFSRFGAILSPNLKLLNVQFHSAFNAGMCVVGLLVSLPLEETFNKPLTEAEEKSEDRSTATENSATSKEINLSLNRYHSKSGGTENSKPHERNISNGRLSPHPAAPKFDSEGSAVEFRLT